MKVSSGPSCGRSRRVDDGNHFVTYLECAAWAESGFGVLGGTRVRQTSGFTDGRIRRVDECEILNVLHMDCAASVGTSSGFCVLGRTGVRRSSKSTPCQGAGGHCTGQTSNDHEDIDRVGFGGRCVDDSVAMFKGSMDTA